MADIENLHVLSITGFDGKTRNGLHVHPDGVHIVYPIGNAVAIQNVKTKMQKFLHGHTNLVSAIALSSSGKYVASGQINYMGFKATVIIWDFESASRLGDYQIHTVRVEYLAFGHEDRYLFSLGGRDDTRVLVYDVANREPICGAPGNGANSGIALSLAATNLRPACFVTGGDRTARLWRVDAQRRKLTFTEVNFNKVKRIINCITIDPGDDFAYCGTTSGDLVKISLGYSPDPASVESARRPIVLGVFGKKVEKRTQSSVQYERYSLGVTAIIILGKGRLMIGSGDGTVEEVQELEPAPPQPELGKKVKDPTLPRLKVLRKQFVDSGVSTMRLIGARLLVGTESSEMFTIGLEKWDLRLETTCHTTAIYDVCFPSDMSSVLATGSKDNVRIWNTVTSKELLRITVANMTCSGVLFQHDGRALVTSWNDGKIRAFTPQTGQLIYMIHNAHNKGVSALAATSDDRTLVSGGGEGQVRVWDITPTTQTLHCVLQEHKGPVSAIHLNSTNDEAASASTDGSCIIWDIIKYVRKNIIFANTLFMTIRFHTSNCQILTAGTDRKIAYWETFDGSLIRDIEGSKAGAINSIDFSPDGRHFVTGGNDQIVKLWLYEEGEVTHVGIGHARMITQARFSPDGAYIVSVSSDGAIFRWKNPYSGQQATANEMTPVRSESPADKS